MHWLTSLLPLFIISVYAQNIATPSAIPTLVTPTITIVVSQTPIAVSPSINPTVEPSLVISPTVSPASISSLSAIFTQTPGISNTPTPWPTEAVTGSPTWTYIPLPTKENPLPPPLLPIVAKSLTYAIKNVFDPTFINPFGKIFDPYNSTVLSSRQTTIFLTLAFLSITTGIILIKWDSLLTTINKIRYSSVTHE